MIENNPDIWFKVLGVFLLIRIARAMKEQGRIYYILNVV